MSNRVRPWRALFATVPFSMAVAALSAMAQNAATASQSVGGAQGARSGSWRDQAREVSDRARAFVSRHFGEPCESQCKRGFYTLDTNGAGTAPITWMPLDPAAPVNRRAIILVHGLDELDDLWDDMGRAMNTRRVPDGVSVLKFEYANDASPTKAAEELDAALRALKSRGVRSVDVVGHSMGGLVARDVLTRPSLAFVSEPRKVPKVERLLMAGTPNHGSALATLQWMSELREQLVRWAESEDRNIRALGNFSFDGKGEAADDLLPGSKFLLDLNSRPAPSGVAITNIIGRIAVPGDTSLEGAVTLPVVKRVLGDGKARKLRDACRDMQRALGDGVVPVGSAWLDGVEETVFVEATHCGLLRGEGERAPGIGVVLERLGM